MQKEYLDPDFIITLKRTMKNVRVEGGKSILFIARIRKIVKVKGKRDVRKHCSYIDPTEEFFNQAKKHYSQTLTQLEDSI